MAKVRYEIVDGPSIWDVIQALFEVVQLSFHVPHAIGSQKNTHEIDVVLSAVRRLGFSNGHELLIANRLDKIAFEGYALFCPQGFCGGEYSMKTRKGWIEVEEIDNPS